MDDSIVPASTLGKLDERWLTCWQCLRAIVGVLADLAEQKAEFFAQLLATVGFAPCMKGHGWVRKVCDACGRTDGCKSLFKLRCLSCLGPFSFVTKGQWRSNDASYRECSSCDPGTMLLREQACRDCDKEYPGGLSKKCRAEGHQTGKLVLIECSGTIGPCVDCQRTASALQAYHRLGEEGKLSSDMLSYLNDHWTTLDAKGRAWVVLQCFNASGKPEAAPTETDIPVILNALLHCQPVLHSLSRQLRAALPGLRETRNSAAHAGNMTATDQDVKDAVNACRAFVAALDHMPDISSAAKASMEEVAHTLMWLEKQVPGHLSNVWEQAREQHCRTNSLMLIQRWVDEWQPTSTPVLWIQGPRGSGKSFAARRILYERHVTLANFFRIQPDGRSAATLLAEQLTDDEEIDLLKNASEKELMILDGLDEEEDSLFSHWLENMRSWPCPSIKLLVTSIHPPPRSLLDAQDVRHCTLPGSDASVQQLTEYHSARLSEVPEYCDAVRSVEKQASGDLNYVEVFFSLRRSRSDLLKDMLDAEPLEKVYRLHVERSVGIAGPVIHNILCLLAALGTASPSFLQYLLSTDDGDVARALDALTDTGLITRHKSYESDVRFGDHEDVRVLPGFLDYLRHEDPEAKVLIFGKDYSAGAVGLLRKHRDRLAANPTRCAQTISFILRGGNVADDSELVKFAKELAEEPSIQSSSAALCLTVRALYHNGERALALQLWKDNVLKLITVEEIKSPTTRINGLLRFAEDCKEDCAALAKCVSARLLPLFYSIASEGEKSDGYAAKLVRLPCLWACKQFVGDIKEEASALLELLEDQPHLANELSVETLMKGLNKAKMHDDAVSVYWRMGSHLRSNRKYILIQLAMAYQGLGNASAIRDLIEEHREQRPVYLLGYLLKLWQAKEDMTFEEARDVVLGVCDAESRSHLDHNCIYHLLACGKLWKARKLKAAFLLEHVNDPWDGIWAGCLERFLRCLIAVDFYDEAQSLRDRFPSIRSAQIDETMAVMHISVPEQLPKWHHRAPRRERHNGSGLRQGKPRSSGRDRQRQQHDAEHGRWR